jgi:hypothetical protein
MKKSRAKISAIAQVTSNCESFLFSVSECSNQSFSDNIVNKFFINSVKLSIMGFNSASSNIIQFEITTTSEV